MLHLLLRTPLKQQTLLPRGTMESDSYANDRRVVFFLKTLKMTNQLLRPSMRTRRSPQLNSTPWTNECGRLFGVRKEG